jgi:uncharacterized membrane protein
MEVHHHPHVEKKGLKEYFLEFLMIFLAVTMAFIGENMREQLCDVKYKWKFSSFCVTRMFQTIDKPVFQFI